MHSSQISRREYELAHNEMYQLEVDAECPSCGELIACTVYGADVVMDGSCINQCDKDSHFDRDTLNERAYSAADTLRRARAQHEADL